ncbi:hypothetical protein BYT27DRAFT_7226486 [Phlegmacium glaucopus]|nr:hypothetical protein BYT27DRAFT_7226486 [Phlegmacium glaucopus]
MVRYGNGASIEDIARQAGCSEGSVENYTDRLTSAEKEVEKKWVDEHIGFRGKMREGWVMYDGTIIVLYKKPGLNGDAYYTRKANYGLNAQIGNTPSNLRIVDYSHGMTGSAHDATAFEHTTAAKYPDWFFDGEEFAWADSAYAVNSCMIPVHKKPASDDLANSLFDKHCMGALKGRFQCLRGLRVNIQSKQDHHAACRWITIAIILHNLIIDVEGEHSHTEDDKDCGVQDTLMDGEDETKEKNLLQN